MIYTRSAIRSRELWQEFAAKVNEPLFRQTGVLWLAHEDDPLAEMRLTADGFRELAARAAQLAPRVAAVLEGGYNLETLPRLVDAALEGFSSA